MSYFMDARPKGSRAMPLFSKFLYVHTSLFPLTNLGYRVNSSQIMNSSSFRFKTYTNIFLKDNLLNIGNVKNVELNMKLTQEYP